MVTARPVRDRVAAAAPRVRLLALRGREVPLAADLPSDLAAPFLEAPARAAAWSRAVARAALGSRRAAGAGGGEQVRQRVRSRPASTIRPPQVGHFSLTGFDHEVHSQVG